MTTQTLKLEPHATWTDGKRYLWLLSPLVPILGLFALGLHWATGLGALTWFVPLVIYGLIPLLDWRIGVDPNNPPDDAIAGLENDRYYRAIVYAYLPSQYLATALGAWVVVNSGLAWWEYAGLVLSVGAINGIGINTSHELGHKRESLDRWLAKLTLAPVAYGHFFVEHNRGHHKNVATPEDPASSKMGESFWRFLPRSMIGGIVSAWSIEKERLARNGKSVWSLENDNLQTWAMTAVLFGALTAWLGWPALLFLALQAFYGASLLEVINYIEHYGLLRKKLPSGRYERCAPKHSWNSNHIVTNLFLYQLQRHSDHHANPMRRFQALRHFEESPQLPSGYASMLLVAYVPPLWFRLMNPRVAAHHDGDLAQANLHPAKRDALMARWQREAVGASAGETSIDVVANTAPLATRHQCPGCGYVYNESIGCPQEGFPPGTRWSQIPETWACPDCAVRDKPDFQALL